MKKCQHGDLVPVTVQSLCNGGHIEAGHWMFRDPKYSFICNRVLASKLFRTLMRI
jgi:hypothetical protein